MVRHFSVSMLGFGLSNGRIAKHKKHLITAGAMGASRPFADLGDFNA